MKFVTQFRTAFPLFAQRTDDGRGFVQQDAEECWSTLLTTLSPHSARSDTCRPPLCLAAAAEGRDGQDEKAQGEAVWQGGQGRLRIYFNLLLRGANSQTN